MNIKHNIFCLSLGIFKADCARKQKINQPFFQVSLEYGHVDPGQLYIINEGGTCKM